MNRAMEQYYAKVLGEKAAKELHLKFIKSYESYYIIASIVCCHETLLVIDGHHRYFTLKKLGFKKIPVTKIDYQSSIIKTGESEKFSKQDIINHALANNLMDPKSTSHKIYCNKSKKWEPIMLLSSSPMFISSCGVIKPSPVA